MISENKLLRALPVIVAASLVGCGSGDADENISRNLFAIGETVKALEDGDTIEDDVSLNDQGDGLTYALSNESLTGNGQLTFNADGTFTYKPNPDFSGKDSYSYIVTQESTGETDTAVLTIDVISDYETPEEAGWVVAWNDDFEATTLDNTQWDSDNATIVDGNLVLTSSEGFAASIAALSVLPQGRFEASIQVPVGSNVLSAFSAIPMADIYDGNNKFTAFESDDNAMIATAHYGLGLISGIEYNSDTVTSASTEFHSYAVEWNDDFIRWYFDGTHIHTVDRLNTWAYNLINDEVIPNLFSVGDVAGPFDQDMQLVIELTNNNTEAVSMLIDSVNVWTCDPEVASELTDCANPTTSIDKLASDEIPEISVVTTDIFIDGYFNEDDDEIQPLTPLTWKHTDEVIELTIGSFNDPIIETITLDDEHDLVIDVMSTGGDSNINLAAPGIELIGHNAVLSFDMYIDSANTLTETFDIRMETGWPYMGILIWNTADLTLDSWVTYSIPVDEFINSPFIAPDWLTWLAGVVEGDTLPLDISSVGSLLTIETHDSVHFQLDNIQLTCLSSDSCVQAPLIMQEEAGAAAPSILIEAEDFNNATGADITTEDSGDEGGGQNVGFIAAGDSLEYNISAPADGTYYVDYRLATESGSDGFTLSVDGIVVDTQTVEPTGGWQTYLTQTSTEFDMTAGDHTLRLDFIGGSVNINWLELFTPIFEIFLEAENFDNATGADITTEDSGDEGGGQNVGFIATGDSLEYIINIPADGTYNIEYRLASESGSDGFELSVDGIVIDTQTLEPTGGWQTYLSQESTIDLLQGEQTLRFDFVGGSININWIKITN